MTQVIPSENYHLDNTIRPQDDFFGHVNNSWLAAHPIPDSEVRWGTFNVLRDDAWKHMHEIYEELQKQNPTPGSIEQQARDFYFTGMHMGEFVEEHMRIVRLLFAEIDKADSPKDLGKVIGHLHSMWINGPWYMVVDADDKDSSKHMLRFGQAGLTLPDRDYYLNDSQKMKEIRTKFQEHMGKVYHYFPELTDSAQRLWKTVFRLERDLAKHSKTAVELRDVEGNYNKMSYQELKKRYDAFDWEEYAQALGWRPNDQISVNQPEFMAYVNTQLSERSLDEWKTYLKWRVVMSCYGKISNELAGVRFDFFGRILSGTTEIMPLWKRVVLSIDDAMGEAVGKLYAEKHFPESSKQQVLSLVEDVRSTYKDRIEHLDWMSDKTKKYAVKKLGNMKVLIGYPDQWRDFRDLNITRDSYLGNYLAAAQFQKRYWLDRLHTPISRDDWFMYPQTVNAYHDPNRLVICFPAAILQAPFFDPKAHIAANLGGIGTVIGHELTHGFDDQGCQFDAEGNVRMWQTDEERESFRKKAEVIIKQADAFKVLPDLNLKGGLIIGESIADLGGIEIAYETLQKYLEKDEGTTKEGLTAEQLFFVTYARTECAQMREEKIREYTLTDWHPTSEFRVNGMMTHVDAFYQLFDVASTDKLYRPADQRARIW